MAFHVLVNKKSRVREKAAPAASRKLGRKYSVKEFLDYKNAYTTPRFRHKARYYAVCNTHAFRCILEQGGIVCHSQSSCICKSGLKDSRSCFRICKKGKTQRTNSFRKKEKNIRCPSIATSKAILLLKRSSKYFLFSCVRSNE